MVMECKKVISNLAERSELRISSILGHSDIDGNGKIDELVRAGSDLDVIGPIIGISSPI